MVYAAWYLGIGIIACAALLVLAYRDGMEDDEDFGVIIAICLATIFVWPFTLLAMGSEVVNRAEKEDGVDGGD